MDENNTTENSNFSSKENKIRKIIESNFDEEINYKKYELEKINERIFEAQNMLDKLRVCIICNYYSLNGRLNLNEYINHPSIANLRCEHLDLAIDHMKSASHLVKSEENSRQMSEMNNQQELTNGSNQQFDVNICVGNVSKYLNNPGQKQKTNEQQTESASQYDQDLITHKWMIYIRSPDCSKLENYIKKVIFYLHSSYQPYDMVEVKSAPFQLIKRGWGEFPVHVQIHFKDARNKRIDITHQLKLDWTQTGLQTFGGETAQNAKLILKPNDYANHTSSNKKTENTTTNAETTHFKNPVSESQKQVFQESPPDRKSVV